MKYGICHHRDGLLIEEIPDFEGIGMTRDELLERLAKIQADITEAIERIDRQEAA